MLLKLLQNNLVMQFNPYTPAPFDDFSMQHFNWHAMDHKDLPVKEGIVRFKHKELRVTCDFSNDLLLREIVDGKRVRVRFYPHHHFKSLILFTLYRDWFITLVDPKINSDHVILVA
jgi:hypothetical protein